MQVGMVVKAGGKLLVAPAQKVLAAPLAAASPHLRGRPGVFFQYIHAPKINILKHMPPNNFSTQKNPAATPGFYRFPGIRKMVG